MTDPLILRPESPEPEEPPAPTAPPHTGRRMLIVAVVVGLVGIVAVTTLLPRWLTTPGSSTGAPTAAAQPTTDERRIQATLFYLSDNGTSLIETSRSVLYGDTTALQVRRLVEGQLASAPTGLINPVPAGTTVRAAFVTELREAYIDLGGAIVGGLTGSLDETLAVYALVNAVTVNLPDITGVQILIDGKEVDSLAGHVDLRAPLTKSLAWVEGTERTSSR